VEEILLNKEGVICSKTHCGLVNVGIGSAKFCNGISVGIGEHLHDEDSVRKLDIAVTVGVAELFGNALDLGECKSVFLGICLSS
jgi:hypothetical protein